MRIGICCALAASTALVAVAAPATAATTSLCGRAEYHQARWQTGHARLLRAWSQGNYERAAVVAGSMSRIAREALADARSAPARRASARAFRARIVGVHEGQRRAAVLYVDAMLDAGAGRMRDAGRTYAQANVVQLRAGFVGDYC